MTNNQFEGQSFDRIPPGTFEALSSEETRGMVFSIQLGRELKESYPSIADDYRSGLTIQQIIEKYNIADIYKIKQTTARAAVTFAIHGYDGKVEISHEGSYTGLITDLNELGEIAHKHLLKGISKQHDMGTGIYAQTPEEQKKSGILFAESQGKTVFSDEEINFLKEKASEPEYQRRTRIHAQKLAKLLNEKFHNGKNIRTPGSVKKIYSRLKSGDRK